MDRLWPRFDPCAVLGSACVVSGLAPESAIAASLTEALRKFSRGAWAGRHSAAIDHDCPPPPAPARASATSPTSCTAADYPSDPEMPGRLGQCSGMTPERRRR